MLEGLDKGMRDFLKFKEYKRFSVKEKVRYLLIYPFVLTVYTYALIQHKLAKK